ncbi:Rrf2 family transcriptional regulator [Limnohabitans sp. INBF002]|uniref:RrF2 family transcriptional regulator n=1 Tax=Limnohabitans sp. INBF002 TaxID=2986280 RepID=UPI002377AE06|nr:Rrf2 family transcriptional regulator [Limnohabitans sp. INBF002]BDU53281.1 Fe-S cluster assembly transcriptional regulator IscR [Limnohabitans sp. INBF002]
MISKKTINAIEVCVYLAGQRHAGYVTTTEMSPRLDLSISYLENILKPLKAHHIVSAMKGPGGGYMIQGDMSLISIWDITSVLECTLNASPSEDADMCDDTSTPASYELGLEQIVKATLSNFTLADFVDESRDEEARSFVQTMGRFKFKPMVAPLMPKAPNSVFQLSMMMA